MISIDEADSSEEDEEIDVNVLKYSTSFNPTGVRTGNFIIYSLSFLISALLMNIEENSHQTSIPQLFVKSENISGQSTYVSSVNSC